MKVKTIEIKFDNQQKRSDTIKSELGTLREIIQASTQHSREDAEHPGRYNSPFEAVVKDNNVVNARKCHVEERKAQGLMKFTLSVLSKEAQSSNHTDATLAIRVPPTFSASPARRRQRRGIKLKENPVSPKPGSHKDNPKVFDDDDDKEREKQNDEIGTLEIRNEETQATIPTLLSSPRKILSSDEETFQELTDIVSNPTISTSKHSTVKKRISSKYSHLPGALCADVQCPRLYDSRHGKEMCHYCKDREGLFRSGSTVILFPQEFKAHALAIIEELFKNHVQSNVIHVHPTTTTSTKIESSANLQYQLYLKMNRNLQDRADDILHCGTH
ncbi:hypothetical protein Tco_0269833 [Tanacetum coccineum]